MSTYQDHFSGIAGAYERFRPRYPSALFAEIAGACRSTQRAWDVGCGNGQASVPLAEHFDEVLATDASSDQIARAVPHPRVRYSVATAENSGLVDRSVDLILVAQALHWFRLDPFYEEVRRVAREGALFCALSYERALVSPPVDRIVRAFYKGPIHPYWPEDRRHVETHYRELLVPFAKVELAPRDRFMTAEWTAADYAGYLSSWSAVHRYREATGVDPIPELEESLRAVWGETPVLTVRWPLSMVLGTVAAT